MIMRAQTWSPSGADLDTREEAWNPAEWYAQSREAPGEGPPEASWEQKAGGGRLQAVLPCRAGAHAGRASKVWPTRGAAGRPAAHSRLLSLQRNLVQEPQVWGVGRAWAHLGTRGACAQSVGCGQAPRLGRRKVPIEPQVPDDC